MPPATLTRRTVMRRGGTAIGTILAGCSSTDPPSTEETHSPTEHPPTRTPTSTSTYNTVPPALPNEHCPPASAYDEDATQIICYQDVTPEKLPLYLEPSPPSASLPTTSFTFTLFNRANSAFSSGPYAWDVHKRVNGEWYHIAPTFALLLGMKVKPGGSFTWSLKVDNTALDHPLSTDLGEYYDPIPFNGLGNGTYTFGIAGWHETYNDQIAVATQFRLRGDELSLTPTATVGHTDRSGDTITVIVDPQTDHDDRAWYEFIVTQIANPPKEPRRLIPEQVIRETPLRNALTHFEAGIQRVRVITKTLPTFIVSQPQSVGDDESDKTAYIEYDQQTYKVEAKPPEQSQTPST